MIQSSYSLKNASLILIAILNFHLLYIVSCTYLLIAPFSSLEYIYIYILFGDRMDQIKHLHFLVSRNEFQFRTTITNTVLKPGYTYSKLQEREMEGIYT